MPNSRLTSSVTRFWVWDSRIWTRGRGIRRRQFGIIDYRVWWWSRGRGPGRVGERNGFKVDGLIYLGGHPQAGSGVEKGREEGDEGEGGWRRTWSCPVIPISTLPRPTNRGISEAGRNNLAKEVCANRSIFVIQGFWRVLGCGVSIAYRRVENETIYQKKERGWEHVSSQQVG